MVDDPQILIGDDGALTTHATEAGFEVLVLRRPVKPTFIVTPGAKEGGAVNGDATGEALAGTAHDGFGDAPQKSVFVLHFPCDERCKTWVANGGVLPSAIHVGIASRITNLRPPPHGRRLRHVMTDARHTPFIEVDNNKFAIGDGLRECRLKIL